MDRGSKLARVVVLLVLAGVCAAISNLAASSSRKLTWAGSYPRAMEVAPAGSEPGSGAPPAAPSPPPASARPVNSPAPASTEAGSAAPPGGAPPGVPAAPDADVAKAFPPHPDKPAVEIGPADAERLYRARVLFLDARRSSVYGEGHIAGARSFPVWESDIDDRVKKLYEEGLDQRAPIVVYCSGGNCEDSHMLAEKLYMVGFDNVLIYKDGFPDWQKRGLPTSKGANP